MEFFDDIVAVSLKYVSDPRIGFPQAEYAYESTNFSLYYENLIFDLLPVVIMFAMTIFSSSVPSPAKYRRGTGQLKSGCGV